MTNLSHIFPSDYLNPPTEEDLHFEVQDLLRRLENPRRLINKIDSLSCPFYKAALMQCLQQEWHTLVEDQDPRTGYEDSDGCWVVYWIEAEKEMNRYINRYHNEQYNYAYSQAMEEMPINEVTTVQINPTTEEPTKETMNIVKQVKTAVKQVFYELSTANNPPPLQPLTININTTHNHYYYKKVGQVTDTINEQINNQL